MRRIVALLALLALLAVALISAPTAPIAASPRLVADDIYLALGDSLSTGTEAAANNDDKPGYPAYLNTLIEATTPISDTLLGIGQGETSSRFLEDGGQLESALTYIGQQRAAGKKIGLITLSIGGNDIINVFRGGSLTITETLTLLETNLDSILSQLTAASLVSGQRETRVLLMNYYNAYPGQVIGPPFVTLPPGQEPIVTDRDLPKFNQMLAEVAARYCATVTVVDAFRVVQGNEAAYLFANPAAFPPSEATLDYHPREAGHQALAAAHLDAIDQFGCVVDLPLIHQ